MAKQGSQEGWDSQVPDANPRQNSRLGQNPNFKGLSKIDSFVGADHEGSSASYPAKEVTTGNLGTKLNMRR